MFEVRSSKLKSGFLRESNLEPRISNCSELSSVGRKGRLTLEYVRQGPRTALSRSSCRTPWHLFPPIYLDDTGCAYTLLLNPSGGLVGGDHLAIDLSLGTRAHVLVSTPSANKVYRSLRASSVQAAQISVGPGAILEWIPEPTIPFAGSRFRQAVHVTLAPGATAVLWDTIASGRIAGGERWAFASLDNEIRITTASGASVSERYTLRPDDGSGGVGLVEPWNYVASFYAVGDAVGEETWKRLEENLAQILDERFGRILGGVSQPAVPGLTVKLVARSAQDLAAVLQSLWAAVRRELLNLPPVVWRKY